MNTIKIGGKIYKYEGMWRDKKTSRTKDSNNNILKWPKHSSKKWQNQDIFIEKLYETHKYLLRKNKFKKYKNKKKCLICKKRITKGLFEINKIRWEDGLLHYIKKHNVKPSHEFISTIFKLELTQRIIYSRQLASLKGRLVKRDKNKYIEISRNQIMILDALMRQGGFKEYIDKNNQKVKRYSEHAGLLDFNNNGLERIMVSGNIDRVDTYDDDIFFPRNITDAFDYEYIFHTHPPTPDIGSRMNVGILYEFPSISDIFHFLDHYNGGNTQGSIVIAPEGMYIIRKYVQDYKKIIINEDKFYKDISKVFEKVQIDAINKYKDNFTIKKFYSKIAQDTSYIEKINNILKRYKMYIDYYPRIKSREDFWVIDTIFLPVSVIEPKRR